MRFAFGSYHLVPLTLLLFALAASAVADDWAVDVRIFEEQPEESWLDPMGEPTTEYREAAFGFVRIPQAFSRNALALDRSTPFSLEATMVKTLEGGKYRFRLRSKGLAAFSIDGLPLLATQAQEPNRAAHEALPNSPTSDGRVRAAPPPHQDVVRAIDLGPGEHRFRLVAVIGGKGLAPFPGELSVSVAREGEVDRVLGGDSAPWLTDEDWERYAAAAEQRHAQDDIERRRAADAAVEAAWAERHRKVREWMQEHPRPKPPDVTQAADWIHNDIDRYLNEQLLAARLDPRPLVNDLEFLRRLSIDTAGRIPAAEQVEWFLGLPDTDRREAAIRRFLADDDWAAGWIPYWQDVLAENPGILKPDLNNTGPFRWYLHQAFLDGYPFDRIVTELIEMEGSLVQGAPSGFGMASLNDAPMAAKADILSQAFLANKLSCARCHDAPFHPFEQKDLFSAAAMLEGEPIKLPESSTVPLREGGRKPFVNVALRPGQSIEPHWPFEELSEAVVAAPPRNTSVESRHLLASLVVSPANERFARVVANRTWKRFMGLGLVEPVDDWSEATPSHPELLDYLAYQFVVSGYDLKHLSGLIFRSHAYQRSPSPDDPARPSEGATLFAGPQRRQMSAEQLVDSLHLAVGKGLDSEELNLNPLDDRSLRQFLNMGEPQRAWEMTALSNERDRPSLALPRAQAIVDLLSTWGWRQSRQSPISVRESGPSPMQTLALANGSTGTRVTRLSDDSYFTMLALEDVTPEDLINRLFLRALTRRPTEDELEMLTSFLQPGFEDRVAQSPEASSIGGDRKTDLRVSWANHFDPESTRIRMEEERKVRMGDPPTRLLSAEFRERFEDVIWAVVNSPEFSTIP